jgi:hypothetical protein
VLADSDRLLIVEHPRELCANTKCLPTGITPSDLWEQGTQRYTSGGKIKWRSFAKMSSGRHPFAISKIPKLGKHADQDVTMLHRPAKLPCGVLANDTANLEGTEITLNEYLDRWLGTAVGPRVRPKTFQDYRGMLNRYVRPVLGERVLAGLRPLDLQAMYQHMSERGLSARTIRYALVLMKGAMQQAVRWRLLFENPADGLKVPQQVRNEMQSLTIEQARALLKAAEGTKYGPVIAVALTTGMRPTRNRSTSGSP